ncbi:MAG: hypothetical protein M1832_005938 [Thelocarpon impressellum]|nr:MAG: hypothetical protein M1832_005938 [Thelocarpon impressellum]
MGLFNPASTSATPVATKDGTPQAPNRDQRAHCWAARDAFFACLDANGIVDAEGNAAAAREKCGGLERGFERDCASSWVHYFKRRRVMEHNRNETLARIKAEGARPLPGTETGPR